MIFKHRASTEPLFQQFQRTGSLGQGAQRSQVGGEEQQKHVKKAYGAAQLYTKYDESPLDGQRGAPDVFSYSLDQVMATEMRQNQAQWGFMGAAPAQSQFSGSTVTGTNQRYNDGSGTLVLELDAPTEDKIDYLYLSQHGVVTMSATDKGDHFEVEGYILSPTNGGYKETARLPKAADQGGADPYSPLT